MFEKIISYYYFTFTFLKLIAIAHLITIHDTSHGFISKKPRYLNDYLIHFHERIGSTEYFERIDNLPISNLKFYPEVLNFHERSLGVPHSEIVTIYNTDKNKTIYLTSISGSTEHFHSSFFEDKQIPPNGHTTFKIVYLGRQEGPVESTLILQTSNGFVKYNVKAFGTFNNYRMRPIVGVKVPVHSTFTPVIYMHNPHSEPIQIVEIYSSGGAFHLELPSGQHEGPNDLWEINPQETKAVIRVRFEAKTVRNHTAYIRIKLHNPEEILIVPLEVEVTDAQNIFQPQGHIDFGIGGSHDEPKEINLCLFNPLKKAVRLHSVSTLSKSIKTQYYNVRINPGNEEENKCVNVGTLTLDWKNAYKNQDYSGKIIVKFRNGKNRTEIPYFLTVLKGGLTYDKMSTAYFLNDIEMDTIKRKFEVLNEFYYPIRVVDVKYSSDIDTNFKIQTFTPVTIRPFERKKLFDIWLKNSVRKNYIQLRSHINLITNVSELAVPLLTYNGKLHIHLPFDNDDTLNVGLIGSNTKKQVYFMLTNPNPVDIPLIHIYSTLRMTEVEIYGCGTGDHRNILLHNFFTNLNKCDKIAEHGYAIIKMSISTQSREGPVWGVVQIQTSYENISLPVHYKVSGGELKLYEDELVFNNCFPGKTCSNPFRVYSTFSQKMKVTNIISLPPDQRVSAQITESILPKTSRIIGHLSFDLNVVCSSECYTGLLHEGSASWLRTLSINKQVSEYDMKLVNMFYNRFLNFTKDGSKTLENITLRLDTSEVKSHIFTSSVRYVWPSLLEKNALVDNSTLEFPLTQIGNTSYKTLLLHNPSSHNLIVQLVFENDYPHADMLYGSLPSNFISHKKFIHTSNKWFFFDGDKVEQQRKYFWDNLRINASKESLSILLSPGQSQKVTLGFTAEEAKNYSSLLFLRNNLTILEVLRLNAKGTVPSFKFGNRKPGALQPLLFEIPDAYLKLCESGKTEVKPVPNLTIRRSFTARNLGEIPIQIRSFNIDGYPCEGFGFKVLECGSFVLEPNSSKKIDIAFTPDLTLSKVQRTLVIESSLNTYINYTLYALIPSNFCYECESLIERPPWEIYMSYVTIVFMKIMFFLSLFIAMFDSVTIRRHAFEIYGASNSPPVLSVLDLRKIGHQVREEIQSTLKEKMLEEENSCDGRDIMKSEPAIIPTTGKVKKKLVRKNTPENDFNIFDDEFETELLHKERHRKKELLFEKHRLRSRERKNQKENKLIEEKDRKDKQKEVEPKKLTKKHSQFGQEEEASSTTTESSHSSNSSITNSDEVNKQKRPNNFPKQKVNVSSQTVDTMNLRASQENKMKHVSFVNGVLRNRAMSSDHSKRQEFFRDDETAHSCESYNRDRRRRESKFNGRKEKYRNKNKNDRKNKTSESDSVSEKDMNLTSSRSFYIPFPPTTRICPSWCENRARFSDVVARNECANDPSPISTASSESPLTFIDDDNPIEKTSNIAAPTNSFSQKIPAFLSSKPTMYVEPYKPIDLGPIGSKRLGIHENESPNSLPRNNNSFFSESSVQSRRSFPHSSMEFNPIDDQSVIAAISNNTLLAKNSALGTKPESMIMDNNIECMHLNDLTNLGSWNRQPVFRNLTEKHSMETCRNTSYSVEQEEDVWNKIPANSSIPYTNNYWSNTFSSVLNSTSKLSNNSSYLWGSNPIWKPWSPADSPNHIRTPPGFNDQILKRKSEEEQKNLPQRSSYNQFDSDGSWIKHNDF